jgi:hypothetical protein
MTENGKTLTTGKFSQKTGIAVSTIYRMLRQGELQGRKRSGKWAIYASELQNAAVVSKQAGETFSADRVSRVDMHKAAKKNIGIETFVEMTYLTENGVRQWLKTGRLAGSIDADGTIQLDAANLDRHELKHLIRK